MNLRIKKVDLGKTSFQNSYRSLDDDLKAALKEAIKLLLQYPQPGRLRLHGLTGYRKPKIFSIDITTNHSHKATFELDGEIAIFRRIGTHRDIDRCP